MALSKINIIKGSGGLGRALPGEDHISGLVYYHPTALDPGDVGKIAQYFSLKQAETDGITSAAFPILHYHLSEFFRLNQRGSIFVSLNDTPVGAHDFIELTTLADFSGGRVRQIGVFTSEAFATSMATTAQGIAANNEANYQPFLVLLQADFSGVADLSTLEDLSGSQAPKVSVLLGQDGGSVGASLFASEGVSIGVLGAALGAVSLSNVHESISWTGKFQAASAELDSLALADGSDYGSLTPSLMDEIDNKKYIFLQKHIGLNGSFFTGSWTSDQGDYETIELNRAIDKATRNVRTRLLPFLNSPIYVDQSSGQLTEDTIQAFQAEGNRAISRMIESGELSGGRITINPDQNVLSTGEIEISIELVPVGTARTITVTIGYKTSLN